MHGVEVDLGTVELGIRVDRIARLTRDDVNVVVGDCLACAFGIVVEQVDALIAALNS